MKNLIVFLLLLVNVGVVGAQYQILQSGTGPFNCMIVNPNHNSTTDINPWNNKDFVTWIFPDGQYLQEEVLLDGPDIYPASDMVQWSPFSANKPGDYIYAYVAEKGGTGPPPQAFFTFNNVFNGTIGTSPPAPINYAAESNFKFSNLWDLSPGNSTMLVVSYQKNSCTATASDYIEFRYNHNEVTIEDIFGFNRESAPIATQFNNTLSSAKIGTYNSINLSIPGNHNNIFLKVKPTSQTYLGQIIDITAIGQFCPLPSPIEVFVLRCVVQKDPHDPNSKTVDVDTIYANQTDPVKLTYSVQFHNDGEAPVHKVVVTDALPPELNPSTFHLVDVPYMNGLNLYNQNTSGANSENIELTFMGNPGLPGLSQTNPSFSYGETIYRYSFEVETYPNKRNPINNTATVTFYDDEGKQLGHVVTDVSDVFYSEESKNPVVLDCCCRQKFWWRFWNICRRHKKEPCKRSQKGK